MTVDVFSQAVDRHPWTGRVDLIQLDVRWRGDGAAMALRDRIDARIQRELLCGADLTVRRIVLYDIPSDEGGGGPQHARRNREHGAWVAGLVRDLHHLGMLEPDAPPRYRLRQLILGRVDRGYELPPDGISWSCDADWQRTFDDLWADPRCIENNILAAGLVCGPEADRDPFRGLWR